MENIPYGKFCNGKSLSSGTYTNVDMISNEMKLLKFTQLRNEKNNNLNMSKLHSMMFTD